MPHKASHPISHQLKLAHRFRFYRFASGAVVVPQLTAFQVLLETPVNLLRFPAHDKPLPRTELMKEIERRFGEHFSGKQGTLPIKIFDPRQQRLHVFRLRFFPRKGLVFLAKTAKLRFPKASLLFVLQKFPVKTSASAGRRLKAGQAKTPPTTGQRGQNSFAIRVVNALLIRLRITRFHERPNPSQTFVRRRLKIVFHRTAFHKTQKHLMRQILRPINRLVLSQALLLPDRFGFQKIGILHRLKKSSPRQMQMHTPLAVNHCQIQRLNVDRKLVLAKANPILALHK